MAASGYGIGIGDGQLKEAVRIFSGCMNFTLDTIALAEINPLVTRAMATIALDAKISMTMPYFATTWQLTATWPTNRLRSVGRPVRPDLYRARRKHRLSGHWRGLAMAATMHHASRWPAGNFWTRVAVQRRDHHAGT
jgi:hypothetical protein